MKIIEDTWAFPSGQIPAAVNLRSARHRAAQQVGSGSLTAVLNVEPWGSPQTSCTDILEDEAQVCLLNTIPKGL